MNILIIPSWYPYPQFPYSGIFVQQQASALAKNFPNDRFIISSHCPYEFLISPRNILNAIHKLNVFYSQKKTSPIITEKQNNFVEISTPSLTWSEHFLYGNLNGIRKAHLKNLNYIQQKFGTIDLIHAHVTWPAGHIGWYLAQLLEIPFIITEHMGPFPFPNKAFITNKGQLTPLLEKPLNQANSVVAVSESLAKRIRALGIKRVEVIPNIVDETLFIPKEKQPSDQFQFLCVAHLSPSKGIDDLLIALAKVITQAPHVRLQLIGGGMINQYKHKAESLKIDRFINFIGPLPHSETISFYQSTDAFVLPSYSETFGISYIEALACGKPIIATRCGGPEDIVTKTNGVLVDIGQPDQLAQAMLTMINQYKSYSSKQIRQDCLQRFSTSHIAQELMNLYLRLRR
ncbi:hypothetical protein COW36_10225 [bacterium (Candidatus Blackallbacteria) CG17_big_fil_post_rev_8_21_14_2_50_48_46]|uniref:Glycosyltransferase family 4 protein n=1 Tax=bacterium (Candidatus Blackallbacteria) CG17_big_fil_post_rev_8_21_14_2_50_48_46 TaxID=2014261 RepID=A0A2M7G4X9_9BACT|nr:MAG: hypothetical protein COW64_19995 [bacterium (Candidatus Blackallbacteria) CG18_big_fil_WC_8_21_14_2_50_49_26]PIW17009.1 MAG: hypothetical protein COW36_10225 [bacterium (Candidatus Blackallbacteria) CG17_big_fil_post_rev_8_21_14_2_50_48_46]PIW48183.1 MAG: hypothetical protein COW20_10450 [bacterium (Candidatus Blackallbacteria) CG13_big_fil_rev_8_21_14_2_50_49_14]